MHVLFYFLFFTAFYMVSVSAMQGAFNVLLLFIFSFYSSLYFFKINATVNHLHLQRYSRKHRRSQEHNIPGCQQKCQRSPRTASGGTSSQNGGTRKGDTPLNTACKPGIKPNRTFTLTAKNVHLLKYYGI